jgi:hypothetical protein
MNSKVEKPARRLSIGWRVLLTLLLSPLIGGMLGGIGGAGFIFVSYFNNPQSVMVGSSPDPIGVGFLAFLVYGFVGLVAGFVIGLIGAAFVAIWR